MSRKIIICELKIYDEFVSDTGDFDDYQLRLKKDCRGFLDIRATIPRPQFVFDYLEIPDTVFSALDNMTYRALGKI